MSRDIVDTRRGVADGAGAVRGHGGAGRGASASARWPPRTGVSDLGLELLARYRAEGDAGLVARSRRPRSIPNAIAARFEDEIVALRKELTEAGLDAVRNDPRTPRACRADEPVPSVSTIWRVLSGRGFVTPQPHKRPESSWRPLRSRAAQRVLAGRRHPLAVGRRHRRRDPQHHRRPLPAAAWRPRPSAGDQGGRCGRPPSAAAAELRASRQSLLTDNGAIFTAELPPRGLRARDSSCSPSASSSSTPGRITPRPAARSNASTRPSRNGWPNSARPRTVDGAPSAARPVRRLLQHRPAPPGARATHTRRGLRRPAQSQSPDRPVSDPDTSGSATTRSTTRQRHPPLPQPPPPHRRRSTPRRHTRPAPRRRPRHPRPHRRRRTPPPPHPRPDPRLPAPGPDESSTMSRDSCPRCLATSHWRPRQDSNLRTRLRRPMLYPLSYEGSGGVDRRA